MEICIPGNYPSQCFSDDGPPFFLDTDDGVAALVIDIHHFTTLAETNTLAWMENFVTDFFFHAEETLGTLGADDKLWVNKYIGDALFMTFDEKAATDVISAVRQLIARFRMAQKQEMVAVMDRLRCLKGGVGGNLYYDYSYWGHWVNGLFRATKHEDVTEGMIWVGEALMDAVDLNRFSFCPPISVHGRPLFGLEV